MICRLWGLYIGTECNYIITAKELSALAKHNQADLSTVPLEGDSFSNNICP